jgi:hypothetical protein
MGRFPQIAPRADLIDALSAGFLAVVGTLKSIVERYLAGELSAPPEMVAAGGSLIKALLA